MKEHLERIVICKKCRHGARLYHDPRGGCIKTNAEARPKFFIGSKESENFRYWVVSVCKRKECTNYNKPVPLPENEFNKLKPPCCSECEEEMIPYRDHGGKGDYCYKCENKKCSVDNIIFADLLPKFPD